MKSVILMSIKKKYNKVKIKKSFHDFSIHDPNITSHRLYKKIIPQTVESLLFPKVKYPISADTNLKFFSPLYIFIFQFTSILTYITHCASIIFKNGNFMFFFS